jgi:hypothetical protein
MADTPFPTKINGGAEGFLRKLQYPDSIFEKVLLRDNLKGDISSEVKSLGRKFKTERDWNTKD